jgi:UDP-N-acetylmuramoyl-L-alanyl-D-glutamate--2,6-diaminopimelate ligase
VLPERGVALATLLDRIAPVTVVGERERWIAAIEVDSRRVGPGALFVALPGAHTDGHRFVADAIAKGAAAVVVERAVDPARGATVVQVGSARRALSALAAAFFADPSQTLDVIGVTGTNGKTTTTHLIAAVLDAAGSPCGIVGTVGAEFAGERWPLENTTPLPPELHGSLARMRRAGARAAAMEVSSHALTLDRVDDVRFRVAVLTNVTRDHLDFHLTPEAYAAAKRRLFALAPFCVLNSDDPYGARWARELGREGRTVVTYGSADAMLVPSEIVVEAEITRFVLDGRRFELPLAGRFNVQNALAAVGVARCLGIDDATAARALAGVGRIPGRMERISAGGIAIVVDYAHTPDALESALTALRETTGGALAIVFGCGGDRDRGKRAQMGAVAARFADRLYVTSDNPRGEDPQSIADAIVGGIGSSKRVVELDRRRAIERAVAEASPGDVVLVAGKGHETYQIVGDRVLPFDDAAIAREVLAARGAAQ